MNDGPTTPFPPYGATDELTSSGRMSLARATIEYCLIHWGMDGADIVAALSAEGDPERPDRTRVLGAIRLFGRSFADGAVRTFARRFGGGSPVLLEPEKWELDDYQPRFMHSALALDAPWEPEARLTHWIFVDEGGWRELLERSCADVLPAVRRGQARSRGQRAEDNKQDSSPAADSFLRLPEVRARTGLARSTIYARIGRGEFPRQVDLDGNIAAWRESDVSRWIASRSDA